MYVDSRLLVIAHCEGRMHPLKLADRYVPEDHEMTNNPIYVHYQVPIEEALRPPGDLDLARERISPEAYDYHLTDEEREFYEQLYVATVPYDTSEGDDRLVDLFGRGFSETLNIGENEKDLLEFLETNHRLLCLVAPVGWGKTVLLKYVWFYLITKSAHLTRSVIPIYISCDQFEDRFTGLHTSRDIVTEAYSAFLRPRLMRLATPFCDVDNDSFWDYLREESGEFPELAQDERAIAKIYSAPEEGRLKMQEIYKARLESMKLEHFPFCLGKYLVDKCGKTPLFIFDNVDPMCMTVHTAMLQKAVHLTEKYGFRVVISMRELTYDELAADPNGLIATYPMIRIRLKKRDVCDYLTRRTKAALSQARTRTFHHVDHRGVRITQAQAEQVLSSMIDVLLSPECSDLLGHLSFWNLRKLNLLLLKYLASGYIETDEVIWQIVRSATQSSEITSHRGAHSKGVTGYSSPLWVALSSLLTVNHATRFSGKRTDARVLQCAINVYCNGGIQPNDKLIRLHLLNYLERYRRRSYDQMIEDYGALFNNGAPQVQSALCRALRRMLGCNLAASPESYRIRDEDDVPTLKLIELTDKGSYFRKALSVYFEYLIYMKDDVELGNKRTGVKDCIDVTSRNGRYEQLCSFLEMLYEEEDDFLRGLRPEQLTVFMQSFSRAEDNMPFMTGSPVEAMLVFGEQRLGKTSEVARCRALAEKIAAQAAAILDSTRDASM